MKNNSWPKLNHSYNYDVETLYFNLINRPLAAKAQFSIEIGLCFYVLTTSMLQDNLSKKYVRIIYTLLFEQTQKKTQDIDFKQKNKTGTRTALSWIH